MTPPPRGVIATDRLMLGYLAINTAIVAWRAPQVGAWPWLVLGNGLTVLLIALLRRAPATRLVVFLGGGYPLILTAAFYTQLGVINLDVAHVHDPAVQRWEEAVFGSQVSMTWHQRAPSLALSWVMHACYGSYYWLVVVPLVYAFARHSREGYERLGFIVALAFYACYVGFALFPVAGPRYVFGNATGPIAEVLPARLVRAVLEGGSAWGTAFPSSHVAASWCAVLGLWRDARRVCLALAPIALGLALGTVYGQFHYGVDAAAGAAVGLLVFGSADHARRGLTAL